MIEILFNFSAMSTLFFFVVFVGAVLKQQLPLMKRTSAWFIVFGLLTLIVGMFNYIVEGPL